MSIGNKMYIHASTKHKLGVANRFNLYGKVALVTGAAGGFGSSLCVGLAQHGADVALVDLWGDTLPDLSEQIHSLGRKTCTFEGDICDEDQVKHVVSQTVKNLGRLDILIHTVGVATLKPLLEMRTAEFSETLASCLTGAFQTTREAARVMAEQGDGGSIVLVSSISSKRALGRGTGAYAASKAGVNALVREASVEWAKHDIRVNAVAPCQFLTPGLEAVLDDPAHGGREALEARMLSRIPMDRFGRSEEIVGPCIFLASTAASMVTGQVLFIDGGYTAQ